MNTFDTSMTIPIARAYIWPDTSLAWFSWVVDEIIPISSIPVYRNTKCNVTGGPEFLGVIRVSVELVQRILSEELLNSDVAQPVPWSHKIFKKEWLELINSNIVLRDKLFSDPEVKVEIERQFESLYRMLSEK